MTTFRINSDKEDPSDILISAYTFNGEHDFKDEDGYPMIELEDEDLEDLFSSTDIYALKIVKGRRTTFYVKRGRHGHLYNPIGMYTEGTKNKQMRHAGRPEWRFEVANAKIFKYYIQFLKTKNPAWLRNAEREV